MCCNKTLILIVSLTILFIIVNIFLFCFFINSYNQSNILQSINSQAQVSNEVIPLVLDNLSGSTLIKVNGSFVISLIGNSSSDLIYQDVSISVIRIA